MRSFLIPAVAALAVLGFAAFQLSPGAVNADDQTIDTGNLYFCSPQFQDAVCDTSINTGDTVTWDVSAGFHTVTECDDTFTQCPPAGGFDSGQLQEGDTYSQTFDQAGSFEYYCVFHPTNMRGRIVVSAQATGTATPAPTTPGGGTPTAPAGGATQPAATSTAGGLPATGGDPAGDGSMWLTLTLVGLALLGMSAGFVLATRRS